MKCINIEIAIMQYYGIRQNLIVPNVTWGINVEGCGLLHECDLLVLSQSNYATEIEIKVSKSDLLKDKEKEHGHKNNAIKMLFFAVPKKLEEIALKEIPERAGLYVIEPTESEGKTHYYATLSRGAIPNKRCVKWSDNDRNQLARLGTMRILGLKKKIA